MLMTNLARFVGIVAVSVAISGCGGGGGGGSCGNASCGGDLTGTWGFTSACIDTNVLKQAFLSGSMGACTQASVSANLSPTGTISLNTDGTYALALTLGGTTTINIPTSCLNGATCADLDAALQAEISTEPSIQSISCTGTSTCACVEVPAPETSNETGTYTTSGSTLTTTPTGASPDMASYCVKSTMQASTLTVGSSMMANGAMGNLVETLTAQKQ